MSEHDEDAVVARATKAVKQLSFASGPIEWNQLVRETLSALKPGDRLPGGLRVVPEEPTEAMTRAAEDVIADGPSWFGDPNDIYHAMLAATTTERGQNADG